MREFQRAEVCPRNWAAGSGKMRTWESPQVAFAEAFLVMRSRGKPLRMERKRESRALEATTINS